jgi:CHAT domain-containing protein
LGCILRDIRKYTEARVCFEEAAAMDRRLYPSAKYPNGRPEMARRLNNLGNLLCTMGDIEPGRRYFEQSLAMCRRLFPKDKYPAGHPTLALSLNNLSYIFYASGRPAEALPLMQEAARMYRSFVDTKAAALPEADAIALVDSLPQTRDGYLSAALRVEGTGAAAYEEVWASKAALTRVLERRHLAARVAMADRTATVRLDTKWRELGDDRRQIARLLLDPAANVEGRDHQLAELTDHRDRLERELTAALPGVMLPRDRDQRSPTDLARALPAGAVFIDILAYNRFEQEPNVPGEKGARITPCYAAFVVRPGRRAIRVELGEAKPIDEACYEWRRVVVRNLNPDGADLRRLVWEPIAEHLGSDAQVIYLSPDEVLAIVPWAALPGEKPGSTLLDDWAFAIVPHGPFLLDHLTRASPPTGPVGGVLAVGAVAYGPRTPPQTPALDLPASALEQAQVRAAAGSRPVKSLTGAAATTTAVLSELPKVRFAHLATHGFFAERKFTAEYFRQKQAKERFRGGLADRMDESSAGLGIRNPLAYTGLILAGANNPATAGPDGGILTGETLLQSPLENLDLVVLSACDTGLGAILKRGEGVEALVRAFHLAGCPAVVASLWSVDDDATAALMAVFYDGLWTKEKPPMEALRRAQLAVRRHPELIAALAGREGDAKQRAALAQADAPPVGNRRSGVRLWAAFVLSGTGK